MSADAVLAAVRPAQDLVDAGDTQLLRVAARWADCTWPSTRRGVGR